MIGEQMHRPALICVAVLVSCLHAIASIAQPRTCEISPFRGAAQPGGAVGSMAVVNNGQPCGLTNYGVPAEGRNPGYDGRITLQARHGKAEIIEARVQYTPDPGYMGEDEFAYQMSARANSGTRILLKVRFKVKVAAPD